MSSSSDTGLLASKSLAQSQTPHHGHLEINDLAAQVVGSTLGLAQGVWTELSAVDLPHVVSPSDVAVLNLQRYVGLGSYQAVTASPTEMNAGIYFAVGMRGSQSDLSPLGRNDTEQPGEEPSPPEHEAAQPVQWAWPENAYAFMNAGVSAGVGEELVRAVANEVVSTLTVESDRKLTWGTLVADTDAASNIRRSPLWEVRPSAENSEQTQMERDYPNLSKAVREGRLAHLFEPVAPQTPGPPEEPRPVDVGWQVRFGEASEPAEDEFRRRSPLRNSLFED